MMGISMKLWVSSIVIALLGSACGSSKTVDQINAFADKVCACRDAACAISVETDYLEWWKQNQRARGSDADRKDVEKAMERYAKCNLALVGPEQLPEAVQVPKVDLYPEAAPADAAPAAVVPSAAPSVAPGAPAAEVIGPEPSEPGGPTPEKAAPPTP